MFKFIENQVEKLEGRAKNFVERQVLTTLKKISPMFICAIGGHQPRCWPGMEAGMPDNYKWMAKNASGYLYGAYDATKVPACEIEGFTYTCDRCKLVYWAPAPTAKPVPEENQ